MNYLRVRYISIDVVPDTEPFITIALEKVIADDLGNVIQVIGDYDRIIKRLHEVVLQPSGTVASDGYIDGMELYVMLANVSYTWVMQKHGGQFINGKVVVA